MTMTAAEAVRLLCGGDSFRAGWFAKGLTKFGFAIIPLTPTDEDVEAMARATDDLNIQGFLYGRRHVIRNLALPPDQQEVWSYTDIIEGHDYCHSQMMREIERMRWRAAYTALAARYGMVQG